MHKFVEEKEKHPQDISCSATPHESADPLGVWESLLSLNMEITMEKYTPKMTISYYVRKYINSAQGRRGPYAHFGEGRGGGRSAKTSLVGFTHQIQQKHLQTGHLGKTTKNTQNKIYEKHEKLQKSQNLTNFTFDPIIRFYFS